MNKLVLLCLVGASIAFDCSNDGMFVDPEDCAVFHRCVGGRDYPGKCPAGTLFNQPAGVCDWPANVDCDVKPTTPAPTTKPGPTTTPGPTTGVPTTSPRERR